jgi:hypothetical protein
VVAVTDRYGNLVTAGNPSITVAVVSGPAGAILYGTRTVSAVSGHATFSNLSLNLPGTYSLAFTSGSNSPGIVDALTIVGLPARRYLFNGSPLSGNNILMQQERSAPSIVDLGPPISIDLPAANVLSAPADISAANFSDQLIAGDQLFAASDSPDPSINPILDSGADSLQKLFGI